MKWLKQNKTASLFLLLLAGSVAVAALAQGCRLSDFVRVNVPAGVRAATAAPATVPLTDAPATFEQWQLFVTQNTERFAQNIDQANAVFGFLASIVNTGATIGQQQAATFPGGAILVGAIGMGAGLFVDRPGTKKRIDAARNSGG